MSPSASVLRLDPAPDADPAAVVAHLNAIAGTLDLFGRLKAARAALPGKLTFTTSFGLEDQAIAHAILSQHLDVDLVTLDTGRLFQETHDVWAATEQRYGVRIRAVAPEASAVAALLAEQGANGFRNSVAARQACCHVRKVLPLKAALNGAQGWVTGLRADQSAHRAAVEFASIDSERGLIKINPLYDWTRDHAVAFTREHAVPVNELHGRGFLSIGCAPCTRAIQPGEPERAGRWWWEDEGKTECGLHANPLHLAARAKLTETHNA
ncbi:phosphoadenylyl-sulfate reductase [Pseudolabrys sp. Root1462]|jgi:phosphoadenosine phosphosulfate reductase|uniref:phosphoadenylyl-sulfate reductase n=1 Tax=Pseudolabrys sp. Root1462 TaxID=1736466 RepID=UPI0009EA166B|nr:phosphoadenylyl-sulfate reductase [Pseudolabrys sp. Root1462]